MPVPENYDPNDMSPPSDNLKAKEFKVGTRWTLKIRDVILETMKARDDDKKGDRKKLVFYFEGKEKRYVLNTTARIFMEDSLGPNPNDWIGATIELGVFRVTYGDDLVNGFKIISTKPAEGRQPPPEAFTASDDDVPF